MGSYCLLVDNQFSHIQTFLSTSCTSCFLHNLMNETNKQTQHKDINIPIYQGAIQMSHIGFSVEALYAVPVLKFWFKSTLMSIPWASRKHCKNEDLRISFINSNGLFTHCQSVFWQLQSVPVYYFSCPGKMLFPMGFLYSAAPACPGPPDSFFWKN